MLQQGQFLSLLLQDMETYPSTPFSNHLKLSWAFLRQREVAEAKINCQFRRVGNRIGHHDFQFFFFQAIEILTPFFFQTKSYGELICEAVENKLFSPISSLPPILSWWPLRTRLKSHWLPGVLGWDLYTGLNFFLGFPTDWWVNYWMSMCALCFISRDKNTFY